MSIYEIREMREEDIPGAVELQRACFPAPFPEDQLWSAAHLARHVDVFKKGQFVAIADFEVVASCSNCIVSEEAWSAHGGWSDTVGGPFIENHNPSGTTLYGLDVSVRPDFRRRGIMRWLCDARFDLVRRLGLVRYGTAVRIPGYDAYQLQNEGATPEDYVKAVSNGEVSDRTLTPMLRVGLTVQGVIKDYMEDRESHHAAAVLEWRP